MKKSLDPKIKIKIDVKRQVELLSPGDLICVEWCDASVGQSSRGGARAIDVPVRSWGIFIGVLGAEAKHIVLAQNSFRYADGLFDLDYTAIPLSWTIDFSVLVKGLILKDAVGELVNSFLVDGHRSHNRRLRTLRCRIFQQRLSIDGRPD